jgi:hypothetical protein
MQLAKADLVAALRLRFDHYSATTMFDAARERAGLADKPAYDAAEVAGFRNALGGIADRLDRVNARLESLVTDAPATAPAPKPAPAAPAAPAAKPIVTTVATTVSLGGVDAHDDEHVLMCGGSDALGDWDPERACRMTRKADRWVATLELAPDTDIAFKFVRLAKDGTVVWEDGDDRQLVAKPMIEATWR